jgi:hypothetical protein
MISFRMNKNLYYAKHNKKFIYYYIIIQQSLIVVLWILNLIKGKLNFKGFS